MTGNKKIIKAALFLAAAFFYVLMVLFAGGREISAKESPGINYTILGSSSLDTSRTQTVVVSIGEMDKSRLGSAVLTYTNRGTKKQYQVKAQQIYKDAALFTMDFYQSSQAGSYELTKISFLYDGKKQEVLYQDTGKNVRFAVNKSQPSSPDAVIEGMTEEGEEQIVTVEMTEAKADVKGAVFSAAGSQDSSVSLMKAANPKGSSSGTKVIVLDPGHGGTDPGAVANGLKEKNLTLKIASYCKSELEKYDGVRVYMTRSSDTGMEISERVNYAASLKADVLVSIHINSAANTSASGAEVYYPNSNYNSSVGNTGKKLAEAIEKKLVALGLAHRGIKIRDSESGNTYPGGSAADYYGIIRQSKLAGFPGIIVEHAFISNAGDAKKYLGSDAALKKLGVADAAGIAETYGLKKKGSLGKTAITRLVGKNSGYVYLNWKKVSGAKGYEIYRSTSKNSNYKKIKTISKGSTVTYKDKSVKAGKTYYYKIRGYKTSGGETVKSGYSGIQKVKVLKKISSVSGSSTKSQVKVKWKAVGSASKYQIYRSTSKNGTYKKIATVKKGQLSYKDKSVKKNKTYFYKVRAVGAGFNGNSYGSYSTPEKIRTKK